MAVARRPGIEAEAVLGKAYDIRLMRRLAAYTRPHAPLLVGWLVLMLATRAFKLAQPYLILYVVQHHIRAGGDAAALPYDALAYVGLVIGQNLCAYGEQWVLQLAGQRTMHDLRIAIFDHVLAQRAAFFDRMPVGRLMTRMTNDIESLNEMFAQGAITIVADAIEAVCILGVMMMIDFELALVTFATLPLLFVVVEYARRAMRKSFRQIRVRLAAMNAFAQEHLFGIRVVQLLGRGRVAQREYDEINAGHRDSYLLQIRADAAMYALVEAIGYIAIAATVWCTAAYLVGTAEPSTAASAAAMAATVAVVVGFIEYINMFFVPIRDLSAKYAVMQGAMAASERIFQLLDTDERDGDHGSPAPTGKPEAAPRPALAGPAVGERGESGDSGPTGSAGGAGDNAPCAIELAGVYFSYGAEPVLRGVDLRVPRGATVAVVGATGSGKSTAIKLLTRLYERDRGAIRLDGVDVRDLPLSELRRRITVVSQDVILFAGTLEENIALGKPYPRERLDAAWISPARPPRRTRHAPQSRPQRPGRHRIHGTLDLHQPAGERRGDHRVRR